MIQYKECDCDEECWEEIVVKDDEHYQHRTVIYFHCSCCGEDFRVEDFETKEPLSFTKVQEYKFSRRVGKICNRIKKQTL